MSSAFARHWRSVPADAIVWHEWDGEFVVRSERSGSSHLLGPLAGRILQVLLEADSALSIEAIAAQINGPPIAAADPDLCAAIDKALSEFRRIELALPVLP